MPEVQRDGYYMGAMDDESVNLVISLAHKKRKSDRVTIDYKAKNFKNHIKGADKVNAKYFCIIGSNEMDSGSITIKNLIDKTQEVVELKNF